MSRAAADPGVVMRDALFIAGAVRVSRPCPQPDPVAPVTREDGYGEGLRQGTEEGLRRGREEGRRAGYEEGLLQGHAAAQAQAGDALKEALAQARKPLEQQALRLDAVLAALGQVVDGVRTAAEEDLLVLCLDALCRVLGAGVAAPGAVQAQVRQVLAAWEGRGAINLYLHPDDVQVLEDAKAAGQLPSLDGRTIGWLADPRVALGGCLLQGQGGGLDARLETVLEQAKAALLASRAPRASVEAAP